MERLWAPWRMAYIGQDTPSGCIFCDKPNVDEREAHVVLKGEHSFVMLNAFPYNTGHLLVAPYSHIADLAQLSDQERLEVMGMLSRSLDLLQETCQPDGFNVGVNLGRVAGAGIVDHLHWHVVPRWNGDTNFMPVLAETKVLPEALETTWEKMRAAAGTTGDR